MQPSSSSDGCQVTRDAPPSDPPATASGSNGLLDVNGTNSADCLVSATAAPTTAGRLALSLWLRPSCGNNW